MIKAVVLAAALNVCVGNPTANHTESLNEDENLQIFGDFVTLASKNSTEYRASDSDGIVEYLRTHVIRVKAPLLRDKYFYFDLGDLIQVDKAAGRKKRTKLREILLPILLGLKYKLTVVLPLFMAFVLALALKGFWAGMTGLFISKLVALKLLLQSQNKQDDDHEEDQGPAHEHSASPVSYEIPQENEHEEELEDDSHPVIIRFRSDSHPSRKFSRRRKESHKIRWYYNPKRWNR